MVFDTLPTLILGLPATLGALQMAFGGVVRGLERNSGAELPDSLPFALALMTLASIAAGSGEVWSSTDPSRSEEDVRPSCSSAVRRIFGTSEHTEASAAAGLGKV